jgi:hypothetical protein
MGARKLLKDSETVGGTSTVDLDGGATGRKGKVGVHVVEEYYSR